MKSWQRPTPEEVRTVILRVARPEMAAHFLGKLNNPYWIEPLKKHGLFKHPPPTIREGNSLSFPIWPAARYLVRAAGENEAAAAEAVAAILDADATDNHLVHLSYAEVALLAPVAVALPLVRAERAWIQDQPWLYNLLPEKYAQLAARLASQGAIEKATKLLHTLLWIAPRQERSDAFEPKARFDPWHYREALKTCVQPLTAADATRTIHFLCDLLFELAKIRNSPDGAMDRSFGWRPAIEQSDQNWDSDGISDLIVDTTRDTLEGVIRTQQVSIDTVKDALLKRSAQGIFRRLLLHLARVFKDSAPAFSREQLLDVSQMQSVDHRHEYLLLMRDSFASLDAEQRKVVLSAIANGPEVGRRDLSTPENRVAFEEGARVWKRDRLSMIKGDLDAGWQQIYQGLVESLGEASHPDFLGYRTGVFVGPVSPKSSEELGRMELDALVEYLVTWRRTRSYMAPSEEGLGRALHEVAAKNYNKVLADPARLHRLHPLYVGAIVAGLADAAKAGRDDINYDGALDLAVWASRQRDIPYELQGDFIDHDWSNARRALIDLVTALMASSTGLVASKRELRTSYRVRVWEILSAVMDDRDPTAERERPDADEIEPSMIALNSVRGAALHAVVDYALWVRRWQEKQPDRDQLIAGGFTALPEARDALERHLDPRVEQSLGVRSVYGQWFPWLVTLDRAWAAASAERIFPLAEQDRMQFDAAWFAYVSFNQVYNEAALLLLRQYQAAAERIGDKTRIRIRSLRSSAVALGEHLLVLYGRGEVPLTASPLETFFTKADEETRERALAFIGRTLMPPRDETEQRDSTEDERVPSEVLERFQVLWRSRVAGPSFSGEAPAFGWWFASGRFDDSWALAELSRSANSARSIDGLMFGAQRLVRLARLMPLEAAEFIHALVARHDRHAWVFELETALRPALETILGAGGAAAALGARVVNELGERQIADYSDLLRTADENPPSGREPSEEGSGNARG